MSPSGRVFLTFRLVLGWNQHGHQQCWSSQQQESKQELAALQEGHRESTRKWCKRPTLDAQTSFTPVCFCNFIWLCVFRTSVEPACTNLAKPSWGMKSISAQLRPPARSSTGPFTRRALTPAMAVRRPLTPDTTPTKRATKRWATLPPASTPDPSPLVWMTSTLNWSSRSQWKTRRLGASRVNSLRLMLPSPAAARRRFIPRRTRPKLPSPDETMSATTLLPRIISWGTGGWKSSCYDDGRTLFLWTQLRTLCVRMLQHLISIFYIRSYLFVFGIICHTPKLTHDECQKEC